MISKNNLAIFGGSKAVRQPLRPYNSIGSEELGEAKRVIESGVLSKFIGAWHSDFLGGPKVREFELAVSNYFNVKHAVTVNSWTSGLVAAVGAIGLEPGDEVIVTPWTMSATATAILHWNGIPVFADIDADTYNLDPIAVEACISPYTKGIIVADIFGQSADIDAIMSIASRRGIRVISDSAQSPGVLYQGRYAGTCADVGGYSLNYHKHIHTGEGGLVVTDNHEIAERLRLIRNHGEVVMKDNPSSDISNIVGHNFRLGEIECAIGIAQLKKLPRIISSRQRLAEALTDKLKDLEGLKTPVIKEGCTHAYYIYPLQINTGVVGVSREKICDALEAEGVPISRKYQNVHLLPIYQQKIAFGSKGFPWTSDICRREIDYRKGICPVAEYLNDFSFIGLGMCNYDFTMEDIASIAEAFHKVWLHLDALR